MAIQLSSISRGKRIKAPKIIVYGGAKIGKSTFASRIPGSVFIDIEGGLDALDVAKFPVAQTYQDVLDAVDALTNDEHDFNALALDSLDWMEKLVWAHVCKQHNVASIEQVGGGFGKGYIEAEAVFADFLRRLDRLRDSRNMAIVLIAHDLVSKMQPPDGEPYNYAELKLHQRAASRLKEWSDCIGYATEKTYMKKDDLGFNKKHVRAVGSNNRVLVVGKNPAYVTGNRYGMADEVPLDWEAFVAGMTAAVIDPEPAAQAA